ncbi:MFS transporter [Wukongibacter baidiensis]|uniref:MFS transporter n=1 Tax=Wukongibacter baidiensis TaxID=1723361 RepID=UPI003D7FF032
MNKLFSTRDIRYFSLYSIFSSMVFETPIVFMFLANKGLKHSEITYIFSVYALAVIIFEYLTGVFADKYSKKGVLIFSAVSLILGEVGFILGYNIYHFIGGIIFIALSVAARSGADTAYIYDKLVELDKKEDFEEIMSKLGSILLMVSAGVYIIGPFLTRFGMYIPFLCTIIFYIVAIAVLLKFKEPYIEKKEKSAKKIIKKSIVVAFSNKTVMAYIVLSIIIFPCFHVLTWLLQPYLELSKIKIEYFGIFYTLITIFQSLGTRVSAYLNERYSSRNLLIITSVMIAIGFLLMSIQNNSMVYLIPIVMGISFGIYYTINNIVVNKVIESEIRASLLSLQHAFTKILQMLMFASIGLFIDRYPLRMNFLFLSLYLIISLGVLFVFFRKDFDAKTREIGNEEEVSNAIN